MDQLCDFGSHLVYILYFHASTKLLLKKEHMIHLPHSPVKRLKTRLSLLTLILGFAFTGFSQVEEQLCGTTIDATNLNRLVQNNEKWLNSIASTDEIKAYGGSTYFVPVQIHIIRQNSGLGGVSEAQAVAALERMNEIYIDASIHFYQCGGIDFIDNSLYYDYNKDQMVEIDAAYSQANVVNIFVANTTSSSSGSSICGHAEFPGGLDYMMLAASCFNNGSTLAHEMGHYLGLYHTHTTSFGAEAVNGSDCATEGDMMCDTPADPNLSGEVDNDGCIYEGNATDENGDSYSPQVTNLLSYTSKECRYELTEDQLTKALWTLQNERAYLTCTPPALEANFYVTEEETCSFSKEFTFYNVSQGAISTYNWDFGDGVGTSTSESPSYIYGADGIYTVTLTVSNGGSTETYSDKVVVGTISIPYMNDFEAGSASLDDFRLDNSMKNEAFVDPAAAESGSFGLVFDGTDEGSVSPTFQTPNDTEAFQPLWNPYYKSTARLCVDASWYTNLQLEFDKRQIRTSDDDYSQFVVTINGQEEGSVIQVNTAGNDDPDFTHLVYDLSAYNGQIFTIGFRGTHKYDKDRNGTGNGTATFIDNISITGVLSTEEVDGLNSLMIYPNPADNFISIQLSTGDLSEFSIVDVLGKEVSGYAEVHEIDANSVQLDISQLSSGTYYLRTKNGMGKFHKN